MRIGFVSAGSPSTHQQRVTAFWDRLRELGWVEGQNLAVEQRWAEGRMERLPALMAEVLGHKVDVLVTHSTPGALAAKNATSIVPIVVANMGDPIGTGLASSLARPGGNLTGLSLQLSEGFAGEWLELLHEAIPRLSTVAVIYHPDSPLNKVLVEELKSVGPALSIKLRFIGVRAPEALDQALEKARRTAQAVIVPGDLFTERHNHQIIALIAKHRLPSISGLRSFVDAGGLMSYGVDLTILFRRAAEYVDKILRGAKPADLPIEQPTQFELVVNLRTAKALGLTIPQSILLRVDEVIR
ncbi:MAG: ABC transporter substrate-binding protein [Gammaproteobacteria bacterium]